MIKPIATACRSALLTLSLLALFSLTACDRAASSSASKTARNSAYSTAVSFDKMNEAERKALVAQLMRTAFGKKYDEKKAIAIANLRDLEKRNERGSYQLTAMDIHRLLGKQILLVANAQAVMDNGEVEVFHTTGGLLNLFWFSIDERTDTWKLSNRAENIASLGTIGMFGRSQMTIFAGNQSMLTIESGGTWQGYTVTDLDFFHVTHNAVHALGGVLIHSDSEGACVEETEHCWDISATWKLLPAKVSVIPDLQLDINGVDENMPEKPANSAASQASTTVARVSKKVSSTALYRIKNGKYALIQGENIIPTP